MAKEGQRGGQNLDAVIAQAKADRGRLDSAAFGPFSLTALGIASVVGAGIFVTTGQAAAEFAGPAVAISFVLAGLAAGATALSYAELASMIPAAGSTYSYAYAVFGVFLGWFIGWDLLLEYLFAASTVAVGWSGYAVNGLESFGIALPDAITKPPFGEDAGVINLPAMLIVVLATSLLAVGIRQSTRANNAMTVLKVGILVLFVAVGAFYVTGSNWDPFIPANSGEFGEFGVSGILRGAGVVFFAYVGFDAVSTAAAESRNPRRTVPIGLLATVLISTALYVGIGLVMTGMENYTDLNVANPLSEAIDAVGGLAWLGALVDVAAVVGLAATVLVTFYGQTRIFMRMSSDGMLPDAFGRVSESTKTPLFATVVSGVIGAMAAGLIPIDALGELVSIGTLLAFVIVCAGVLVLRVRRPDLERPFRAPGVWITAPLGALSALALMTTLPVETWYRLAGWLAIGLVIYFGYSRRRVAARREARLSSAGEA
ncbi:MAG TPA: amino acid permease [Solirubrobacterales bacterium]|nr:amino acid permease [Solirubrobacterales bacterium]